MKEHEPTLGELYQWKAAELGQGGLSVCGVAQCGAAESGMNNEDLASYRASGAYYMSIDWASILFKHGAIRWSGDKHRPYVWLWQIKDLTGLKIFTNYSWDKWASFFYFCDNKVKPSIKADVRTSTSWTTEKVTRADDFHDRRTIDLPSILKKLQSCPEFSQN